MEAVSAVKNVSKAGPRGEVLTAATHSFAFRSKFHRSQRRDRHAQVFGLMDKRRRNVRAALERIIEKAGEIDVTVAVVGAAIQACRLRAGGRTEVKLVICRGGPPARACSQMFAPLRVRPLNSEKRHLTRG